jgi:hypothetical protein
MGVLREWDGALEGIWAHDVYVIDEPLCLGFVVGTSISALRL